MNKKLNGILTLLLVLIVQLSFAQQKTVTGTVTDDTGLPLPGVNVLVENTNRGTQTDFDGNYSIQVQQGEVLVFSFLGMTTSRITVQEASQINAVLTASEAQLDEVVVTALGIERKPRELSYSVSSLGDDEITQTRAVNVATA